MTEQQNPEARQQTEGQERATPKKSPSFIAYHVREARDGKSYFNQVGAAFANKDGEGHNLQLDSVPMDGRIVLRTPKERLQTMKEGRDKERTEAPRSKEERER